MAERRMFAKTIVDSDVFVDMPLSTQALYFHLSMCADDEGFINNPKKIQRMIGASDDDLKILIAKRYVLVFDSGVIVIKHWKIHNYIQKDRFKSTIYEDEKALIMTKENGSYTEKKDDGYKMDTKCIQNGYTGKDSIGKDSLGEFNSDSVEQSSPPPENKDDVFYEFIKIYNSSCPKLPKIQNLTEKRKTAIRKYIKELSVEQFKEECEITNTSDFLTGKNDRKWRADFDFLLRTDKAISILEGKYSDIPSERKKSYDTEQIGKNGVLDWVKKYAEEQNDS